jgi:hypothetical protein
VFEQKLPSHDNRMEELNAGIEQSLSCFEQVFAEARSAHCAPL